MNPKERLIRQEENQLASLRSILTASMPDRLRADLLRRIGTAEWRIWKLRAG